MIKHDFKIGDWTVHGYYAADCFHLDELLDAIYDIGGRNNILKQAYETMKDCQFNEGFTYSNLTTKTSILVVGLGSNEFETLNTICHESRHLLQHIALAYHLDENSEDVCYLLGEICQIIYTKFREQQLL